MKYYLDTEFHEYAKIPLFGKPVNTIELISIGIVAEDGREYYAICKEFDIKAAWNNYQIEEEVNTVGFGPNTEITKDKVYWIRQNVLKPIFCELLSINLEIVNSDIVIDGESLFDSSFSLNGLTKLIAKYGKSRKQIAEEVIKFIHKDIIKEWDDKLSFWDEIIEYAYNNGESTVHEFYGYYADYDWVVFCWLFGRMIDLPKGFPMYCRDLKQELDPLGERRYNRLRHEGLHITFEEALDQIKAMSSYPKQVNEHNALADARWNRDLHKFLLSI